jgi:hypothetical protein
VATSTGTVPINAAYAQESRVGVRHSARTVGWRSAFRRNHLLEIDRRVGAAPLLGPLLAVTAGTGLATTRPRTYVDGLACAWTRAPAVLLAVLLAGGESPSIWWPVQGPDIDVSQTGR